MSKRRKRKKSKETLIKIFLFIIAVCILPFTVSLLIHLPDLFSNYDAVTKEMWFSMAGFLCFVFIILGFGPPVRSYILEHELSHILFAFLSGVKVKRLVIRKEEGYVKTERVNLIIAIAPYSLPLYTLFVFVVFRIITLFHQSIILLLIFYLLMGATIAFHLITTIHYLQLDQPDLKRYGYFSSLVFIFTWMLLILSLIFALLFKKVELLAYLRLVMMQGIDFYGRLRLLIF